MQWKTEAEARESIKNMVTDYYRQFKENKKDFVPGDRIAYASRVYDEKEMCALTDAMLDFWLTTGRFAEQFEKEFAQEKNLAMLIGRSNKTKNDEYLNVDESGLVIKNGNGLYAQTEVANTIYYNTFTLKMIENALMELCTNKLDYQQRTFVLKTGQRGAYEFCKAVERTHKRGRVRADG